MQGLRRISDSEAVLERKEAGAFYKLAASICDDNATITPINLRKISEQKISDMSRTFAIAIITFVFNWKSGWVPGVAGFISLALYGWFYF